MNRKILSVVVAVVLCVGVVAGATMAYLSARHEVENLFKFDTGGVDPNELVKVKVAEPNWKWDRQIGSDLSQSDFPPGNTGGASDPVYNKWGVEKATDFRPGRVIPKDPTVVNIGVEDVYVGVIVTANPKGGNIKTMTQIESLFTIDWNLGSSGWQEVHRLSDGTKYFVYNGTLKAGENTPNLFSRLIVNDDDGSSYTADDEFDIVVKSYAVQALNESWGLDPNDPDYIKLKGDWTPETALRAEFGLNSSNTDKSWNW